jgi:DhnA family fructose-bisphosphate aldolase class Ia
MSLEALPVKSTDSGYQVIKDSEAFIKTVDVASGLGESSLNTWIKIPYCDNYDAVALSTTYPILMLGEESSGDPTRVFKEFSSGLAAGSNVRGALVGRNVHHSGMHDPAAVAAAIYGVIHKDASPDTAVETIEREYGTHLDLLKGLLK